VGIAPASADKLDDQKDKVDQQVQNTEDDLDGYTAKLDKTAAKLKDYQDRLPAAQQKLADAQSAVSAAEAKLASLRQRLSSAQADKTKLDEQRKQTGKTLSKNQQLAGQIAAQAYRQGGAGSDLGVLLSGQDSSDLAGSMEMASRAMASQEQAIAELRSQQATDANAAARLKAVEEQIADLTQQADAALTAQQDARNQAQSAKDELDQLVSDTSSAQSTLKTQIASAKSDLASQKKEQASLSAQIKERQARLKREAEERARKAREEAARKAKAAKIAAQKRAANAAKLQREAQAAEAKASSESANATTSGSVTKSSWGLIIPSTGGYISSGFGWRPTPPGTIDYFGTGGYLHGGQDWGYHGACGAPIKAAAAGTVKEAGWLSTHGIVVSIDHNIIHGHALTTNYHHMSKVAVHVGQHVSQGQIIGYVGTTGNSTGCHLHFETIVDGQYTNPMKLLP